MTGVQTCALPISSKITEIPRYKVNKIAQHDVFSDVERSSLFIGMSDGARIDFFRRHHQSISNEQVLLSYHVDQLKCNEMVTKLESDCREGDRFRIVFLMDDFCASGSTLIRVKEETGVISGTLKQLENKTFPQKEIKDGKEILVEPTLLNCLLSTDCKVYLCPLLATQKAVDHIESHVHKLDSLLKDIKVKPVSVLDDNLHFSDNTSPIGALCKKYYQKRMGDKHTKDVTFGYKQCGLPVVLHHNTPNNSLYILWNRLATEPNAGNLSFEPLFKRIERHKSNRED